MIAVRKMYYVERFNAVRREWVRILGTPDQKAAVDRYVELAEVSVSDRSLYPEGFVRLREKEIGSNWATVASV